MVKQRFLRKSYPRMADPLLWANSSMNGWHLSALGTAELSYSEGSYHTLPGRLARGLVEPVIHLLARYVSPSEIFS